MTRALRLATYNVHHGAPPGGWLARHRRLVAAVASLDADVVAVQELDLGTWRSRWRDQAELVSAARGTGCVVALERSRWWGRVGHTLVVRGTVERSEVIDLPCVDRPPRRAVLARVTVGTGVQLSVAACHLDERAGRRSGPPARRQLDLLLERLGTWPAPLVLLGDLNLVPEQADALVSAAGLRRADGPPTYPALAPRRRIDWIAVGDGLRVRRVETPGLPLSDHLPLVATVETTG